MSETKNIVIDDLNRTKCRNKTTKVMDNKKIKADSLEEVLSAANAAYNKHKEEHPNLHSESERVHFVHGWLSQAYENLYNKINS